MMHGPIYMRCKVLVQISLQFLARDSAAFKFLIFSSSNRLYTAANLSGVGMHAFLTEQTEYNIIEYNLENKLLWYLEYPPVHSPQSI